MQDRTSKMRPLRKLLMTGVAVLLLATGAARADEFVVLLQEDNERPSTAFATMRMSCAEALESHERNRLAGTWLMYEPKGGGKSKRIIWIGCLSAVSKMHCPPETEQVCRAQ